MLFTYSIHWAEGTLTEKIGSCLWIRRSVQGCTILVQLVNTGAIVNSSSEVLSILLKQQNMAMRKNATKTAKIRQLLKASSVVEQCSKDQISKLEGLLSELEAKRNKKNGAEHEDMDEDCGEDAARIEFF